MAVRKGKERAVYDGPRPQVLRVTAMTAWGLGSHPWGNFVWVETFSLFPIALLPDRQDLRLAHLFSAAPSLDKGIKKASYSQNKLSSLSLFIT